MKMKIQNNKIKIEKKKNKKKRIIEIEKKE